MATKNTIVHVNRGHFSTTLNEIYPSQSFFLDETVTIGKVISSSLIGGGPYRKRGLFTFDFKNSTEIADEELTRAYLKIYNATANAPGIFTMELNFVSESSAASSGEGIVFGPGRRDSNPPNKDGSSWAFRQPSANKTWDNSTLGQTGSNAQNRFQISPTVLGGYNLYPDNSNFDVDIDISKGAISNLSNNVDPLYITLNLHDSLEDDSNRRGEVEFYSATTHTIYQPTLYYTSHSQAECLAGKEEGDFDTTGEFIIYHQNLQNIYQANSKITFRFAARKLYAASSYGTQSKDIGVNYLPSASLFNFKDIKSNEMIIPNSMRSEMPIESDVNGHYIKNIPSELFHPYRKYQLAVTVVDKLGGEKLVVLPETFQLNFVYFA